jgi:hypothetical protein
MDIFEQLRQSLLTLQLEGVTPPSGKILSASVQFNRDDFAALGEIMRKGSCGVLPVWVPNDSPQQIRFIAFDVLWTCTASDKVPSGKPTIFIKTKPILDRS